MKRLIEKIVFCGLVTAWRLAAWPTSRSPFFVNATTEGVVRAPSLFSKTTGSPPSITDMQELVVPRSIPKTFAIDKIPFVDRRDRSAFLLAIDVLDSRRNHKRLIGNVMCCPSQSPKHRN